MFKLNYFYNPIVKSEDERYYVDIYCSNGKKIVWTGCFYEDSPIAALKFTRRFVDKLNRPRPIFGYNGRICQWLWFNKQVRISEI